MRNEQELREFCAYVTSAAQQLGMKMGSFHDGGKHRFLFIDLAVGTIIEGPVRDSKEEALELACEGLVQYLSINRHGEHGFGSQNQAEGGWGGGGAQSGGGPQAPECPNGANGT